MGQTILTGALAGKHVGMVGGGRHYPNGTVIAIGDGRMVRQ